MIIIRQPGEPLDKFYLRLLDAGSPIRTWSGPLPYSPEEGLERRYEDLEIGLAQVKRWVELHGGELPPSAQDRAKAVKW